MGFFLAYELENLACKAGGGFDLTRMMRGRLRTQLGGYVATAEGRPKGSG